MLRTLGTMLLMVLLVACVADSRPGSEACNAPSIELSLRLTADTLTPSDPGVCRDQEVTLRIASEVDGLIHIHGYDHAIPATEVVAGEELELTFTADEDGQYPIEFHPADDPEGVGVGILAVYDR